MARPSTHVVCTPAKKFVGGYFKPDPVSNPYGTYQSMVKDALTIRLIRDFGMHVDNDRRFFFEHTGRLSFVIYRARVFFQRRFEKIYQILRLLFPREIVAMIMTRHRDSLPRAAPLLHRYRQRRNFGIYGV